jgi:hypothetical protein
VEYIPAQILKNEFVVAGSFYDLIRDGQIIPCRNVLEIYRFDYGSKQNHDGSMFFGRPDAIFIMMNPGSSEPREPCYQTPQISSENLSEQLLKQRMVTAKPDTTQYQVMRLMEANRWDHVRILNLSDIREAKSAVFIKQIKNMDSSIHSVFCPERRKELDLALNAKEHTPIVCAWGINKGLLSLANLCQRIIPSDRIAGLPCEEPNLYYHPLPSLVSRQKEWLKKMLACLREHQNNAIKGEA